jgi:hypothetical protein
MICRLDVLQDRVVRSAAHVEDYFQLRFELGSALSIYNKMSLAGPVAEDLDAIQGKRLLIAEEYEEAVVLRFDDGSVLEVDLRDEAFNGPEAMALHVPGEPIVVWN